MVGWFIINVQSGKEENFREIILAGIEEKRIDYIDRVVVPKHKEIVFKDGKKKIIDKKSYPGYIYVQMEMNLDTKKKIRSLPYAIGFVQEGADQLPIALKENEYIGVVSEGENKGVEVTEVLINFDLNEKVMIIDGPFNGFYGSIKEIYGDRKKLIVDVEIFGRMTPVEIDNFKVKKM